MALTPAQLERNLGYFAAFMAAWGKADTATRDEVYADTVDYRAGRIDGPTEVVDVSALLAIAPPIV